MNDMDVSWMWPGLVLVDVETTGLVAGVHSVHEVGLLAWTGERSVVAFRAQPGAMLDPDALAVCGESWEALDAREVSYADGARKVAAWLRALPCERITIAGMNPGALDLPMMRELMEVVPPVMRPRISHRTVDLHTLACVWGQVMGSYIPVGGYHTDAIYAALHMEAEPRPHAAGMGVECERRAFARIFGDLMRVTESVRREGMAECAERGVA